MKYDELKRNAVNSTLRALRHRNYRLFFAGHGLSLIGTWMQQIAMSWLLYRLTDSALLLGIAGFFSQIPTFIFASLAGVYADRWNRRRLLVATQMLAMLQAFILAFLTLSGRIEVWHIISLGAFLGTINSFDIPARQSFIVDIVDRKEDLGNAIALNSFMFNGARLVGPSIAGILIAVLGEGICFLLNGISFLCIIVALLSMKIRQTEKKKRKSRIWHDLKEGYSYAFSFLPIKYILLQLGLISFMGMPYAVLMPVFARDILHGGPYTLGFLMAASGVGALTGAVYLASRRTILGLGRIIAVSSAIFGSGIFAFSFSRMIPLSLAMMFLAGFGMIVQMAASNTILQTIVEEDKRGRIMSLFAIAVVGLTPFGSLFAGSLASRITAPTTVALSGVICVTGALIFAANLRRIREIIRPIYVKMGIIDASRAKS
ncbi:MAG: MFS transporter [Syntrophales bacterium]